MHFYAVFMLLMLLFIIQLPVIYNSKSRARRYIFESLSNQTLQMMEIHISGVFQLFANFHLTPIFSFTSGATISIELATGFFMTDFIVIVLLFKHYGKKQFFQFFAHHSVSIIAFSLVLYHKG